jgi:hypothetical protein
MQRLYIKKNQNYTNIPKTKLMAKNELYSAIEAAIIRWNLDGTKTAGELTREIMSIIKQQDNG